MCSYKRNSQRRAKHVLLDPSNVHPEFRPLEAGGRGRAPPRRGQDQGRAGQEARQVLPVGRILSLLPG